VSSAGLTFTQVQSADGKQTGAVQIWIDGGSAKSVYLESPVENPLMPPGSYTVVNEQGMYLINPSARTFARFDMSMMQDVTQALGESGLADTFEFTNISVEKVLDEAGESIEGYATRHYQFKSSWTMVIAGSPMSTDMSSVEDIWATDQIEVGAGTTMAFDTSALPASVKELSEAQALKNAVGFPLRQVTVTSTKTNMGIGGIGGRMAQRMMNRATGQGQDTTSTMEVTDLEEVDIPAATFEIPAGYSETQLFQQGPNLPDLNSLEEEPTVPDLNNLPN
jgi:hypothetical protein